MKSQKLKFFLAGGMMFGIAWLGYWVGYVHSSNQLQDPLEMNQQQFKVSQELINKMQPLKKNFNIKKIKAESPFKQIIEDSNGDQVHLVDSKDNKPIAINNKMGGKDSASHVQDIHKTHAKKMSEINQLLKKNKVKSLQSKKKLSAVDQVKEKLAHHARQENDKWNKEENQAAKQQLRQENAKKEKALDRQRLLAQNDKPVDENHYVLMHNEHATRVHMKIHENVKGMPQHISPDLYTLTSKELPKNPDLKPSIGNGHIATVIHSDNVFMNGVYNGYKNRSHRAVIPSTCAVKVTGTEPSSTFSTTYSLNLAEGIYSEQLVAGDFEATQRVYAHRNLSRLLVVEIDLIRKSLAPLSLVLGLTRWTASDDITFLKDQSFDEEVSYKRGRINAPESDALNYTEVHLFYDHIPKTLSPPSKSLRTKWVFITSVANTKKDAMDAYKLGRELIRNNDKLYATHVEAWAELWARGSIDVEGNDELAKSVYSSMYYLYSSLPVEHDPLWPFVGLSPNGLPFGDMGQDYEGHVMWDQETWMYPPLLFFHSDIAKILLNTRRRTMEAAKKLAKSRGNLGIQYPWESAFTGSDVTVSVPCSMYELHVTGDVSRAILQYLYATNDVNTIHNPGGYTDLLAGIANFWVSKLTFNSKTKLYEIKNVMPPDEHAGVVNNSVYTNTIAQLSIAAMEYVYKLVDKKETHWQNFAEKIYMPFDSKLKYHPEYDGYYKGKGVKQADAILLGYPLNKKMPADVRRNDLSFYEKATEKGGPAMTWCMYSIGWLELGELEKGNSYFQKYKEYINGDFQVWKELPKGKGAPNFLTGIGGFLQNIIAGYGGFRLKENHLEFNPILPEGTTQLTFTNIDYVGSKLDFIVEKETMSVILRQKNELPPRLQLYIPSTEQVYTLKLNDFVKIKRRKGFLVTVDPDSESR